MSAATEQITLSVPDVSCAHCVAAVDEALSPIAGVRTVMTDLDSKQVSVSFDSSNVTVDQIAAALDEAGYPVGQSSAS